MATRAYHHGNLREALLVRAEETLRERGVQELSLRELARDIGVSHAAPRRHFADRQALLDALAINGFERLGEELRNAGPAADATYEQRVTATAAAYVAFATDDAALLEVMFAAKHRDPDGPLHEAAYLAFGTLIGLILEGQQSGELMAGDPEEVGMVFLAELQGLASLVNGGMVERAAAERVLPSAISRLLRGSRPPG